MPLHADPRPVGGVQGQFRGTDRAPLDAGVYDVGEQPVFAQHLAAAPRLGFALGGEVHVDPPGEQVLGVPLALAVAEQHQGAGSHATHPAVPRRAE